jgi:hypothetical protein
MKVPKRTRPRPKRDESRTAFTQILERLVELEPAVLGAVIVDAEGEAVDYAGQLDPFYTKVAGAHLCVVLDQVGGRARSGKASPLGRPTQVVVRGARTSFLVRRLPEGYALVVMLKRHGFSISARALAVSEERLANEAGWHVPPDKRPVWYPVRVETAFRNRRRPSRLRTGSVWQPVEVLGSIVGLGRERGYRCRLRSGAELTLLREPAGTWYADEFIDETASVGDEGPT